MKNNILFFLVLILCFSNCTVLPSFIPKQMDIGTNPYGSFLVVNTVKNGKLKGELIAADEEKMVLLTENKNQFETLVIPAQQITKINLFYASGSNYGWSIPIFTLLSFTHGYFMLFTIPFNLISTITLTVNSNEMYSYKNIDLKDISKFARYPQGLPPNIDLNLIER